MASPNINFNSIPSSIRKPGKYFEFNNSLAVRTLPSNLQRVLIVAQMLAAGSAPVNVAVQVFDAETAAGLFGRGSQAHRMVKAAILANPYLQLHVLPISDGTSSTAATTNMTFTGPATAAGAVSVTVGGVEMVLPVASGDTAFSIAQAAYDAINARKDLGVTVVFNGGGSVTLTARNKGALGGTGKLAITSTANGVAATTTSINAGLNDPDLTAALAAVQSGGHEIVCIPYLGVAQLTALRTHLNFVSGPMEQRRAIGVCASTGTLAATIAVAGALNSERIAMGVIPGSLTPSEEVAAGFAAQIAAEEDPARPLNTLPIANVLPPPIANRLSRVEQEAALLYGVTPFEVGPGEQVQIVRAVTTYTLNPQGIADISWLDLTTIRTMDYVAKACRERIAARFPRSKLSARTPPQVRSELLDVLFKLEELEIVEAVEANKPWLIVERDSQDPNRLNARIPTDVVNGLHVFAGRLDLLL